MTVATWLGGVLLSVGCGVLAGYGVYYLSREFFGSDDVPLALKVAVPAAAAGTVILLAVVVVQRLQSRGREHFEEADY